MKKFLDGKFEGLDWAWMIELSVVLVILVTIWILFKGTRAIKMLVGAIIVLFLIMLAGWAGFRSVAWVGTVIWTQLVLVFIIVFQPEIRRGLGRLGRIVVANGGRFGTEETRTLEEIVRASVSLSSRPNGAIIVLERESELQDIVELGIRLEAKVSKELLMSIFISESPLHDGAVVIRGDRIVSAGCFLPLSLNPEVGTMLGTRHRAAIGITEETDAIVVAISGETGAISVIMEGKMNSELDAQQLREVLGNCFSVRGKGHTTLWASPSKEYFPARSKSEPRY